MRILFVLLTAALLPTTAVAQTQSSPPTCEAAEHRAMDFWIGEWDAYVTGTDNLVGRSSITSEDSGCAISEHWRSVGQPGSGRSLNIYDRETQHWEQFWVGSSGDLSHFVGNPIENGMVLTDTEARIWLAPGAVFQSRITLTREPNGTVRQRGDTSGDGQTWTSRYDYTYRRRTS